MICTILLAVWAVSFGADENGQGGCLRSDGRSDAGPMVLQAVRSSQENGGGTVRLADGANGGAVLLANLSKQSVLLKLECDGMRIHKVRMIDNLRTDIVVPMLASLPPLSILLVECTTGKG